MRRFNMRRFNKGRNGVCDGTEYSPSSGTRARAIMRGCVMREGGMRRFNMRRWGMMMCVVKVGDEWRCDEWVPGALTLFRNKG